jgi:hypothetical protein
LVINLANSEDDSLRKEIESWKNGFAYALRADDCNKYANAINAKGELFATESLFIALLLEQQKMIIKLIAQISGNKE